MGNPGVGNAPQIIYITSGHVGTENFQYLTFNSLFSFIIMVKINMNNDFYGASKPLAAGRASPEPMGEVTKNALQCC